MITSMPESCIPMHSVLPVSRTPSQPASPHLSVSHSPCPSIVHRLYQHWATEVDSSIYSTPVIFDVASDGVKDIVIPAFARHVEVLNGPSGQNSPGFPFTVISPPPPPQQRRL